MSNGYYTITSDYSPINGGNSHAIMITKTSSESAALAHFQTLYGFNATQKAKIIKGIHVENGYNDLLTEVAKKTIVKIISGSKNSPSDFFYQNRTHFKYDLEE